MSVTTEEEKEIRSELLANTLNLFSRLDSLEQLDIAEVPPNISIVEEAQRDTIINPVLESTRAEISHTIEAPIRPILPNKWDLKFTGEARGMSLSAFLERVEVLRKARRVSKEMLLESGIDLFTGRAYQFYLAYKDEVTTWDELVTLLKEEFHAADYNEKLFEEIKKRTQGPDESIGIYLAIMSGYFKRLTCPISEPVKLRILLRNLAPFYQNQLGLVDITSIDHLKTLCRRLEIRRTAVANYTMPSRRTSTLEPDLAYIGLEEEPTTSAVDTTTCLQEQLAATNFSSPRPNTTGSSQSSRPSTTTLRCWNCQNLGHTNRQCTAPKTIHCYRCGNPNVTSKNCRRCLSGNDYRRSQ